MRHSKATEATVSLSRDDGALVLTVADNGQGLPEHVTAGGGLTGMRERAMLIGAALAIRSAPRVGVEVTLRLGLHGKT